MSAQSVPVPDTTPEEEFDLFGPGPAPQHLKLVGRPLVVWRQVEAPLVAAVQLEKETKLPSLLVCCDSHCNRTSR